MQSTPTLEVVGTSAVGEVALSACLICNTRVDIAGSLNIFYTSLPSNGELLASFVLKVLRPAAVDLRSSHVCLRCYELFRTLEQAQWTVSNVRCEILRVYRSGSGSEQGRILPEEIQQTCHRDDPSNGRDVATSLDAETLEAKRENHVNSLESAASTCEAPRAPDDPAFRPSDNDYRAEDSAIVVANTAEASNFPKLVDNVGTLGSDGLSQKCEASIDTIASEAISSHESTEYPNDEKSSAPSTWRSGRISKYSQKPFKYSCTTCEKKCRTSAELKTHVKSHSSLRPYMCEKCGQAYKHKHALEIHVSMHNGVSPFKCNVCDKCFTQKGALMRHLPMHTGETPYQCELCGKRFVHHTSYNMHALSHTGKKSYQCHVCNLSLLSTSHLKRHMRVHTGEKPYSCLMCGKSFAERYNLFAHQKIHDPTEIMARAAKKMPFKCDRCDEHFDKKQKLEEHTLGHESQKGEHENQGTTSQKKWTGHTNEVNSSGRQIEEFARSRANDHTMETWRDIDYEKLANSQITTRSHQSGDLITQESINVLIGDENYDRAIVIQVPNAATIAGIDTAHM